MHHFDLELFYYQINFIKKLIKEQCNSFFLNKMNHYLSEISHYPNLKIFSSSIQLIFRLIASKYHDLIKVMIFVVNNLYEKNAKNIKNYIKNKNLIELYKK